MRCSRSGEGSNETRDPCDRCKRHNRPCRVPTPRLSGRKPGSRGRYHGVEKALRKVQAELRKAKTSDSRNLQQLLDLTDGKEEILDLIMTEKSYETQNATTTHGPHDTTSISSIPTMTSILHCASRPRIRHSSPSDSETNSQSSPVESNGSVSNPLGLVADACGEAEALCQQSNVTLSFLAPNTEYINLLTTSGQAEPADLARDLLAQSRNGAGVLNNLDKQTLEHGLCSLLKNEVRTCQYKDYFKPSDINEDRDTGPDVDPVDLGLVSMEEAHYLFPL